MDEKIGMGNLEGELVRFFVFSPFNFKEKHGEGGWRGSSAITIHDEGRKGGGGGNGEGNKRCNQGREENGKERISRYDLSRRRWKSGPMIMSLITTEAGTSFRQSPLG